MRQQFLHATGLVRGQAREHVLEIGIRVMPVHARRLHQAHDGRGPLPRTQAAGKLPVFQEPGEYRPPALAVPGKQ